ncbi:tetratricopeptide repeat protein [Pantanalinema sp. GBBB05]|uniref:tetratricopeptide repeat protein n=1 Tax=Pantanalinema sp. GBBB05 TaxID=2604139 RepID=UPI001DF78741|nr:tetratricopeptide repeat protein [Pantanalinema sp. GBBB05]
MEVTEVAATPQSVVLEDKQRFSQSMLWQLQRHFFEQQGIQAWRQGTVPHYITSNPHIANAYAQVVLGFLRDCHAIPKRKNSEIPALDPSQPIYILELGSGSGRFAYHFLKKFHASYTQSSLSQTPVKYILTDFTEQNLNYWKAHPSLQPYLETGLLDFARFDAETDQSITLSQSGDTLSPESLSNPLIVIANYVLDTIPQDLFLIENGQISESLVTLTSSQAEPNLNDPELLTRLEINYTQQTINSDFYDHDGFNQLLKDYQQTLTDTYLLFPHVALRCLNQLRQWCGDRLLFLSGDKGYSREEDLLFRSEPGITLHGSFSLMVNYHAIGQYVQQQGGVYLTTPHRHTSLNICAAIFGAHPQNHPETHLAFTQAIVQNSPDDFFALKKVIESHYDTLSAEQILSYLRLSGWDAATFLDCFPAIMEHLEQLPSSLQEELFWAVQNIWELYYPIEEQRDLAFYLGMLLYSMEYFPEALEYLQQSRRIYGDDPNTIYNMGMCHYRLRQLDQAMACMTQTLKLKPEFEPAKAMRIKIKSESHRLHKLA